MNNLSPLFDENYTLLTVIVDRKNSQRVIDYAKKIKIKRFTSFRGRGTLPNPILKMLEMDDVYKEVILFVIPSVHEENIIQSFTEKFHFDKPNRGILFTVKLSRVLGMTYKAPEDLKPGPAQDAGIVGVCAIVNKGNAEQVMDTCNRDLYLGGTIIPAHGSIDKSKKIFDQFVESDKEMVLLLVPESRVRAVTQKIADEMNFEKENSGVLYTFAVHRIKGLVDRKLSLEELEKSEKRPDWSAEQTEFDAVWAIVPSGTDRNVIQAAERGGSQGGTIIHARGAHIREHGLMIADIEPQREVVILLTDRKDTETIANEIDKEFRLDEPGQGIVFVHPIHETIGIFEKE
ncbi:P-II family nitrogen regulator [Jeotgalibaca caeni]|uniref:P-II family nitrogen regulator n=1 Tax=Jeotgalibaca caeni TaxID=3028623 RepID=UPI00237D554D|nr:P-II family nitrogen regulator [Jeotgalibaca caeni]MDE1548465.1 P-II family nitrogen regulator [Jeotgalibaca caeni]